MYQQTNARLWRQGQTADTVVIHHIVTEGTIDERILEALGRKDRTQEGLMEAVRACFPGGGGMGRIPERNCDDYQYEESVTRAVARVGSEQEKGA